MGTDDRHRNLSPAELELELGRLALAVRTVADSSVVATARQRGLPHPGIEAFLAHCERLMGRTPAEHQDGLVRRLVALAAAADLGIVGLEAWLTDPLAPAGMTSSVAQRNCAARRARFRPRSEPREAAAKAWVAKVLGNTG